MMPAATPALCVYSSFEWVCGAKVACAATGCHVRLGSQSMYVHTYMDDMDTEQVQGLSVGISFTQKWMPDECRVDAGLPQKRISRHSPKKLSIVTWYLSPMDRP